MPRDFDPSEHLYFDRDMAEPLEVPLAGGTACCYSSRCPDKATSNEDAAALLQFGEQDAVLVVADGMGGSASGEQASRLAVEAMHAAVDEAQQTDTMLRTAVINGFERANQQVQQLGVGAATTLAVVEITGETVRPYHAGDSVILIVGGRGKLKLWTLPHSAVGYGVEAGLLDEIEAMHHEDRHIVSNIVGTPEMRLDVGPPVELAPRDTVLLASDGLFDNLHLEEIVAAMCKSPLAASVEELVAAARSRMIEPAEGQPSKPDDLTIISYRQRPRKPT